MGSVTRRLSNLKNRSVSIAVAALALIALSASSVRAQPAYDFIDAGWIGGIQRYIYGSFTTAPADPGYVDLFIIGPIFPSHPQDELTLEPFYPYHHDHVAESTPQWNSKLVRFFIVRPGPNATPQNLKTRTVEIQDIGEEPIPPPGLEFGETLDAPWAIKVGHVWQTLRKTETIHAGIEAGILTTIQVEVGVDITGWSSILPAFNTEF